jgi:hypothetical protein
MVIVDVCESVYSHISKAVSSTVTWTVGTCSSIKSTACDLRQRVHNAARNTLLTSLGWFTSANATNLMHEVENLRQRSYALFGSKDRQAFEIVFMISALSARLLIAEEKKQQPLTGIKAKTHNMLLSSLIWLEGKEPSISIPQSVRAIKEKIEELWKKKQNEYLQLIGQTDNTLVQAQMDHQE